MIQPAGGDLHILTPFLSSQEDLYFSFFMHKLHTMEILSHSPPYGKKEKWASFGRNILPYRMEGEGGKVQKNHLCVSISYHSRTKNYSGLYVFHYSFLHLKLVKSILLPQEHLSNPPSLFHLQLHFLTLDSHHFLYFLL